LRATIHVASTLPQAITASTYGSMASGLSRATSQPFTAATATTAAIAHACRCTGQRPMASGRAAAVPRQTRQPYSAIAM
jgi:hypothetical protein